MSISGAIFSIEKGLMSPTLGCATVVALGVCEQIVTIRDKLPFPAMTSNTCYGSHSGEVKKYSLR